MRLRQVALVSAELDPVVAQLCEALGIEVAYSDPGVAHFGLVNAVMPVGDTFLEVVSPTRDDATAARYRARRGGDAGYMAIFQVPDLAAAKRQAEDQGVRIVWQGSVPGVAGAHLHPKDVGGAIVSFDQADPPDGWPWAGPEWRAHVRTEVSTGITGIDVASTAPEQLAARWSAVLGAVVRQSEETPEILIDGSRLRFVPCDSPEGEGIVAVDIAAAAGHGGETHMISGVHFRLQ